MHKKKTLYYFIALFLGVASSLLFPQIFPFATFISQIIMRTLKLISLPMVFFSIASVIGGIEEKGSLRSMGKKTFSYVLLTTFLAALLSLLLFVWIGPVEQQSSLFSLENSITSSFQGGPGYLSHLIKIIPENIVELFYENNVVGVLLAAVITGVALLSLPEREKKTLLPLFSSGFTLVLQISRFFVALMPLFIWAFSVIFVHQIRNDLSRSILSDDLYPLRSLGLYLLCIVLSNFIHATLTLPAILWMKNISPRKVFFSMMPALNIAFFASSSNIALPITMRCAKDTLKLSQRVIHFVFPLCSTINMNACAAFILTTVLFVSMSCGISYTWIDMMGWVLISSLAAIANAGIPQGCYFLSIALLSMMKDTSLQIMGMILPFYVFIDMAETAVNVWSDSCVAAMVERDLSSEKKT